MTKKLIVGAAAVLLVGSAVVSMRLELGARSLRKASAAEKGGQLADAERLYRAALDWGRPEAAVALAKGAYREGRWEEVREFARAASRLNPLSGYPHTLLAYAEAATVSHWNASAVQSTLEQCRRSVALDPQRPGLWRSYAELALTIYLDEVVLWGEGDAEGALRREVVEGYRTLLALDSGTSREILRQAAKIGAGERLLRDIQEVR